MTPYQLKNYLLFSSIEMVIDVSMMANASTRSATLTNIKSKIALVHSLRIGTMVVEAAPALEAVLKADPETVLQTEAEVALDLVPPIIASIDAVTPHPAYARILLFPSRTSHNVPTKPPLTAMMKMILTQLEVHTTRTWAVPSFSVSQKNRR
jgi:hypothetical protein